MSRRRLVPMPTRRAAPARPQFEPVFVEHEPGPIVHRVVVEIPWPGLGAVWANPWQDLLFHKGQLLRKVEEEDGIQQPGVT